MATVPTVLESGNSINFADEIQMAIETEFKNGNSGGFPNILIATVEK